MSAATLPTGARRLLAVASFAVALAAADTYVVVLALTDMMAGVGVGIESLQRGTPIISGFLLGYVAMLPLIGRVSDLVDRTPILRRCLVVFIIGSTVTALAVTLDVMVIGRFLQGLGGGGLVPATFALVADVWPTGRRGVPLGIVGAVQELGSLVGPLLGAAVLVVATWREIFWLNAVLGLLAWLAIRVLRPISDGPRPPARWGLRVVVALAALAWALALSAPDALTGSVELGAPFVPFGDAESRLCTPIAVAAALLTLMLLVVTAQRWFPLLIRADLAGAMLAAVALAALVLTFATANPETEVVGPWGVWLMPLGVAAVVGFWIRQRTARDPLIPAGVVRGRVWPALGASVLVGTALIAVVVDVPLLSRLTQGTGATDGALVLVRFLAAVPAGALAGGMLLRAVGPALVAAPGLALAAASVLVMSGWGSGSLDDTLASTLALAGAGLGLGLAIAPINDAALADACEEGHGTVSALIVVARMVGMIVGVALLTALGLHRFHLAVAELPDPTDPDALLGAAVIQVQTVLLGAGIALAAAAVLALLLGWRRTGVSKESHCVPTT